MTPEAPSDTQTRGASLADATLEKSVTVGKPQRESMSVIRPDVISRTARRVKADAPGPSSTTSTKVPVNSRLGVRATLERIQVRTS
jgi:hypothetical protein